MLEVDAPGLAATHFAYRIFKLQEGCLYLRICHALCIDFLGRY